jgi:hypothetical protein
MPRRSDANADSYADAGPDCNADAGAHADANAGAHADANASPDSDPRANGPGGNRSADGDFPDVCAVGATVRQLGAPRICGGGPVGTGRVLQHVQWDDGVVPAK